MLIRLTPAASTRTWSPPIRYVPVRRYRLRAGRVGRHDRGTQSLGLSAASAGPGHRVPAGQRFRGDRAAYVAGRAEDQNLHVHSREI